MKEINIDERLAGQKMMRCLERYLSNAPKSFLYKMLRKRISHSIIPKQPVMRS